MLTLGRVDFTDAKPPEPAPTGEYDGQTKDWTVEQNKDGSGVHAKANFVFEHDGRTITVFRRWPTKLSGLWITKRDLLLLGVPEEELRGAIENLDAVISSVFTVVPTPVRLAVTKVMARDATGAVQPPDPITGEQRYWNELVSVRRIG